MNFPFSRHRLASSLTGQPAPPKPSRRARPTPLGRPLALALLALALLGPAAPAQDDKSARSKPSEHRELASLEREYEKRSEALLDQWRRLVKARDIVSDRIEALRRRKIAILAESHGSEREEKLSAWNKDWDAAEKQKNALAVLWLKHQSLRVALIQEFRARKLKLTTRPDRKEGPPAPAASSPGGR